MREAKTLAKAKKMLAEKPDEPIKCRCKSAAFTCSNIEQIEAFFAMMKKPAQKENAIIKFMHCANCMKQKPLGISPRDWANIECGWTAHGFQVWCKRCEMNVIHIDLLGQKVDVVRNETKIPDGSGSTEGH
jgi:hypothetical protein